jgi:sugar O-acyltransferase (sialic acid O-acetyltransferase NeuD family)
VETTEVILHGGGEHARVVLDCLLSAPVKVLAVFDPKFSGHLMGVPQLGKYDPAYSTSAFAIVSIGSNSVRKRAVATTTHRFTNAIHQSALVSTFSSMGIGNMVLHGAIIQAQSTLGNHVIVNTGAQVDHDCVIGDFVHLAPRSVLCGTVAIGEGTLVGAGAVVLPGKKIGKWVTVGAGAVVTADIPDFAIVVGNPGRIIKHGTRE